MGGYTEDRSRVVHGVIMGVRLSQNLIGVLTLYASLDPDFIIFPSLFPHFEREYRSRFQVTLNLKRCSRGRFLWSLLIQRGVAWLSLSGSSNTKPILSQSTTGIVLLRCRTSMHSL